MNSEKATAVSPSSPPRARGPSVLDLLRSAAMTLQPPLAKQEGSATTRRRSSPAGKRNGGDGPILSPCAAAGSVCARTRTHS